MKYIVIILLCLFSVALKAQQRFPTGFPTQFNTGWNRWGYAMSDSGLIVANRDTNWLAKYSGTIVFKPSNKKFYYFDSTTLTWNLFGTVIDTTPLHNQIVLKLNISDTVGKWLSQSTRLVDTVYRVNDSTVGYTIKGTPYTFQILGGSSGGGGGSGTVTSVGLSMPSAFSVTGSPITGAGTLSVTGAGTTSQYIRGNGTLATTDTGMIPNFYLKVRGLFSGTSPISYNSTTGAISIPNADITGTKGAATFNSAYFTTNGSGLIGLTLPVSAGSCTGCSLNIGADGRITNYTDGAGGGTNNANIGSGYRWLNGITQELRTVANSPTITWDSVSTANTLTPKADTSVLATQYDLTQISSPNFANSDLTLTANRTHQLGDFFLKINKGADATLRIDPANGAYQFGKATTNGAYLSMDTISGITLLQTANAHYFEMNAATARTHLVMQSGFNFLDLDAGNGTYQMGDISSFGSGNNTYLNVDDANSGFTFNTGGARNALLASTGQWTWDGYSALTAQVDTTTYKPVAIDGSGNVVKMAGWFGSGGGGGGISGSGSAGQVTYWSGTSSVTGSNNYKWDQTNKRLSIFNVTTADLTRLNDHSFKTIGNRWYLGDTTSNEPTFIEFGDPYGAANSTPMRMTLGWMGSEEFNIGVNFHYRGQVHLKYDNTKYAQWLAYNPHYFLMQAQGIGYDWNDNAGSKVVWRFDNIESGNKVLGSILSTNGLNIVDYTTSPYQNNDGRQAKLTVSNATLSIGSVGAVSIPDSTQLLVGNVNDGTVPNFGVEKTGGTTTITVQNEDNNSNTNRFRMLKSRAGSYLLNSGDVVFDIQANTLCSYQMVAGSGTYAGIFRLMDHRWTTFQDDGNEYERARISWDGTFMVNTASTAANVRGRRFYVNGSVGANKDSIDLQSTVATRQMLVVDTSTGKFQRMDIPSSSTTIYTGDGALSGNRVVSGASNSLALGTGGSPLSALSVTSNGRFSIFSGITYDVDANNTDADYTVAANTIIAEVSDVLTSGRTLTLPTATINGQSITLLMRYSTGVNKYSLSAAVTDNATGSTFTTLDWGKTYDFMVDQSLAWRLIRKY